MTVVTRQTWAPEAASARRRRGLPNVWLAGDWGARVATEAARLDLPGTPGEALAAIDRRWRERRRGEPDGSTGLVVALPYEFLERGGARAFEVDAVAPLVLPGAGADVAATPAVGVRTSLPRGRYLEALAEVKRHIRLGDIYQANLTQRFELPFGGDPAALFAALLREQPVPRAALVEDGGFALVSMSPETFLTVDAGGRVTTRPIKGTRPRGRDAAEDRRLAGELLASPKERAELTMIVDLMRNDLGRICETGSVVTPSVAEMASFPEVHHLVGRVEGRLRPGVGFAELVGATFPGGSISGAPKLRAIEILGGIEPVPRRFFTGCLFFLGDDGGVDSSILIRTLEIADGVAYLGAGGGIVADSEPELEWLEANHKAAGLARWLGFDPARAR